MTYYPKIKNCEECGKEFLTTSGRSKFCHNPCIGYAQRLKINQYKNIIGIRSAFYTCKRRNPELAEKLRQEMIREEGEEFVKYALGGK